MKYNIPLFMFVFILKNFVFAQNGNETSNKCIDMLLMNTLHAKSNNSEFQNYPGDSFVNATFSGCSLPCPSAPTKLCMVLVQMKVKPLSNVVFQPTYM